jgi:hypothetical protein
MDLLMDEDSLLCHLYHSFSPSMEFVYIGCLHDTIQPMDQDTVTQALLETHNCVLLAPNTDERWHELLLPAWMSFGESFLWCGERWVRRGWE